MVSRSVAEVYAIKVQLNSLDDTQKKFLPKFNVTKKKLFNELTYELQILLEVLIQNSWIAFLYALKFILKNEICFKNSKKIFYDKDTIIL